LHDSDDDDEEDDDDDDNVLSPSRLAGLDPNTTWSIDWKARRYNQPLKDAGIRLFASKDVAKAVTEGKVMSGLTAAVSAADRKPTVSGSATTTTTTTAATKMTTTTASANVQTDKSPAETEALPSRKSPRKQKAGRTEHEKMSVEDTALAPPAENDKTIQAKSSKEETQSSKDKNQQEEEKRVSSTINGSLLEEVATKSTNNESTAPKRKTSSTDEGGVTHLAIKERQAKRIKLGSTTGGWLQAAPSHPKKRIAHARTEDELRQAYAGDADDLYTAAAQTEWAPRPAIQKQQVTVTGPTTKSSISSRQRNQQPTGPNYKAFRKNSVPSLRVSSHKTFQVHRSAPSAAKEAQILEEEREADEQFRKANELFQDTGSSNRRGVNGRRRRLQ
jgi:hypothetical protein